MDWVRRFETLNEVALPFVPTGTIRTTPTGRIYRLLLTVSCRRQTGCGARLTAEAELGFVAPHAMQDDGELARDRDAGTGHAAMLGDGHAPGPQARPLLAPHQQRMCGLVKRRARQFVATSADPALDVGFSRLVAGRGEAEVRANIARVCGSSSVTTDGAEAPRKMPSTHST